MKQVMNESHEVWVLCEQWQAQEGILEIYNSDIMVFASLEEAQEEWRRRRDDRTNREGCKVTASAIEEFDNREFVQAKNYVFTNEQDYSFTIRTLFLRKTYWK